jgi:Asp-tRNA(Asn)/Glu-tRNA(Gln) amidotransferase A subunit family amidase
MKSSVRHPGRRRFLKTLSAAGVSAAFGRALLAAAEEKGKVTPEMVRQAEWIAGVEWSDADRALMMKDLGEAVADFAKAREVPLDNGVGPAVRFSLPPPSASGTAGKPGTLSPVTAGADPGGDLSFATVEQLGQLLRKRKLSSVELTKQSISRLRARDPELKCVITLTERLALEQAARADRELASGKDRGPLHGIPWAAKDLIAVPGYPTTWGSPLFKDQVRPETAAVYQKLEDAGAVLVAKTAVGELAWGDVWFGGTTKNPWKLTEGSSGSSAGSASAVAAGLVPFAIGTETLGSIVSPCTRCGATGLRPTFGRVSRHGVMALAWSMDKIGPITRSVRDLALVFAAIHGADPRDPSTVDGPFVWPPPRKLQDLTIGYPPDLFEEDRTAKMKGTAKPDELARVREWMENDRKSLEALRSLGVKLVPIELPKKPEAGPLSTILTAEAAASFDELVRTGRVKEMVRQTADAWPNVFRLGQMIPAVEYLRANRIRTLLQQAMEELMKGVDLFISPTYSGSNLLRTNLTGHPAVVLPNGFRSSDGTPTSITFTGRLFGESELLFAASAWQEATGFHTKHPSGGTA